MRSSCCSPSRSGRRAPFAVALAIALVVALAGCAERRPRVRVAPDPSRGPRPVVVFVPGVGGTALLDASSGRTLWGDARSLLVPVDRGYPIALPVVGDAPAAAIPGAALERLRLGPLKVEIYRPWKRLMARHGYPVGDPDAPRAGDRFFVFGYDWRRATPDSARALGSWLEALARLHGGTVRVALVAQSSGALVARWLSKYGTATVDEALAGRRRPPAGVTLTGLALIGTANAGSIGVLEELNEGRRQVPLIGGRWPPEVLFTFPSLYESLPAGRRDAFVGADGDELDVDPFDPDAWARHGWSVFDARVRRRVERAAEPVFGDHDDRRRFVESRLAGALRLHEALGRDPAGWSAPPLISLQERDRPTVERAALIRRRDGWHTGFGRRASRAPGDGFATRESQDALSPAERRAAVGPTVDGDGSHFGVIHDATVQRRVLEFLERHGHAAVDIAISGSRSPTCRVPPDS